MTKQEIINNIKEEVCKKVFKSSLSMYDKEEEATYIKSYINDISNIHLGRIFINNDVIRIELKLNLSYSEWHDEYMTIGRYFLKSGYGYVILPNGKEKEYKNLKSFLMSVYKYDSTLFYDDIKPALEYYKAYKKALKNHYDIMINE